MNLNQSAENPENYQQFAAAFAQTIVSQNFSAAQQFLAPWLQKKISSEDLQAEFAAKLWEMNEVWEIKELIYPADFSVSWNISNLESLKEDKGWREPRKFSDELTDENFRQWMVIQFLPDEADERIEFDAWFDFWFAVCEINGELKIGYFEFSEAD